MNNTVIVFESIVIGSGIKWWQFEIPLVITHTCSFEIFVAAINFNSLNHGHLKNRHDLETLEKVYSNKFLWLVSLSVCAPSGFKALY